MPEDNPTPALPPSLQWTARADWIDAEDGTVVCLAPAREAFGQPLSESMALWPERRAMLAAAPALLAALEQIAVFTPWLGDDPAYGEGHDNASQSAAEIARAAIAAARAS